MYTRTKVLSWTDFWKGILRAAIMISFLPHRAYSSLDAFCRVIYRQWISRRHLLESRPASHNTTAQAHRYFLIKLGFSTVFAIAVAFGIAVLNPVALAPALPFCALWAACPLLVYILDSKSLVWRRPKKSCTHATKFSLRTSPGRPGVIPMISWVRSPTGCRLTIIKPPWQLR